MRNDLTEAVREILPADRYHGLRTSDIKPGQVKQGFDAEDGLDGVRGKPVFVQAYELTDQERELEELRIWNEMGVPEALDNRVMPLIDYYVDRQKGIVVLVSPKIQGAKSLKQVREERATTDISDGSVKNISGKITFEEFMQLAPQQLKALRFLERLGINHRDLHDGQFVTFRNSEGNLESLLTDFGTARRSDESQTKYNPSGASRSLRDPLLNSALTGEASKYEAKSDIYSWGLMSVLQLTGEIPVRHNATTGEGPNPDEHREAISNALMSTANHTAKAARVMRVLEMATSIKPGERYTNFQELSDALDSAAENKLRKFARRHPFVLGGGIAAAVLSGLLGLGGALYSAEARNNELEQRVQLEENAKEFQKRIRIAKQFVRDGRRGATMDEMIGYHTIVSWQTFMEDDATGIAAYLKPDDVYVAVQKSGSKKYEDIKPILKEMNSPLAYLIDSLENGEYIDTFLRNSGSDYFYEEIVSNKWSEAETNYKATLGAEREKHKREWVKDKMIMSGADRATEGIRKMYENQYDKLYGSDKPKIPNPSPGN